MANDRMLKKRETSTYAEVLLEGAKSTDSVFVVSGQILEARDVILSHPGLRESLNDVTLAPEARANIITEIFKDFDESLKGVLAVMAERLDIEMLNRVVEEFGVIAEEALGAVIIDVTTVVELDDGLRESIKSKFATEMGKDIMLREHIDASLIGGIVLGTHGKRIDASVSSQLERTRVVLSSQTTGGER